jgi:hypothetical protein
MPHEAERTSQRSGRTWDRNRQDADSLSAIWADFEPFLQGLLVDAEGRPISLSATGFHSALGRIRDMLAASHGVGRTAELLLHELAGRVLSRTRDEADA